MKKLKAFNTKVSDLSPQEIEDMFHLFSEYYANVGEAQFGSDLKSKDYVFLLKDSKTLDIKGFSTIVSLSATIKGQAIQGYFSGDTVVHEDYWGQGTLGVAFLKFLFIQKLKKPTKPLYWFLISKGYKTYLLMANNFKTHYPRYEHKTPTDMQKIIDSFGSTLYQEEYFKDRGIISYAKNDEKTKDHLKEDVTPISDELIEKNPRIAFFVESNPHWKEGDELACIAKMTFSMPVYYQLKTIKKLLKRSKSKSRSGSGSKQEPASQKIKRKKWPPFETDNYPGFGKN